MEKNGLSLPNTKCEHSDQPLLLTSTDLKTPNDSDGEEQNDHILANIQTRRSEPYDIVVHTAAVLYGLVPEEVGRVA